MSDNKSYGDPFDIDNDWEAFRLLDLIDAEFQSDPMSVQCFDLGIVQRVKLCVQRQKRAERKGILPRVLTAETPKPSAETQSPRDVALAHFRTWGKL